MSDVYADHALTAAEIVPLLRVAGEPQLEDMIAAMLASLDARIERQYADVPLPSRNAARILTAAYWWDSRRRVRRADVADENAAVWSDRAIGSCFRASGAAAELAPYRRPKAEAV